MWHPPESIRHKIPETRWPTAEGRHLVAADVEELVGDVERRIALEHLAGDRIAPIARPAGGREVLAAGLDRDPEERPLRRPLHVPRQLGAAAERRYPACATTPGRPCHEFRPALIADA